MARVFTSEDNLLLLPFVLDIIFLTHIQQLELVVRHPFFFVSKTAVLPLILSSIH